MRFFRTPSENCSFLETVKEAKKVATYSSSILPHALERLQGRDNYPTWATMMKEYLIHEDLWDTSEPTPPSETVSADAKKLSRAHAKIIMSVDPVTYTHIEATTAPKDAWDKLKSASPASPSKRRG